MTDDLIEQVARAICCARARCNGCKGDGAGGCFELTLWDVEAQAALAAINLPALTAEVDRLREALKRWQYSGCPDCGGDCGSANPPVMCCIMEETRAALAATNLPALTAWREAVIDELCSLHIYGAEHDADPRKAVRDIIEWNQRLALDPAVSAEARALHTQGWNEAIEAAADVVCGLIAKHAQDAVVADVADKLGQVIRALTKENSDASSD